MKNINNFKKSATLKQLKIPGFTFFVDKSTNIIAIESNGEREVVTGFINPQTAAEIALFLLQSCRIVISEEEITTNDIDSVRARLSRIVSGLE